MRKSPLYSSSVRPSVSSVAAEPRPETSQPRRISVKRLWQRHERLLLVAAGALFAFALAFVYARSVPVAQKITQDDIDKAVLHTLETKDLPSVAARAYEIVRPSVVRVRRLSDTPGEKDERPQGAIGNKGGDKKSAGAAKDKPDKDEWHEYITGTGTGVVIVDSGLILTSLHVVAGAQRIGVVFSDGLESDALLVSAQPENDLAVIQATKLPDDLVPATLKSTSDLRVGDEVIAVGFPFGIGPSASVGAVSGLRRSFFSPEGKRELGNLIQFDAAANPGNSGGPLITADGSVVGIVAAILNPVGQRFFVGLGFAVPIENAAAAVGMPPF